MNDDAQAPATDDTVSSPAPAMSPVQVKQWSMLAHLSVVAALIVPVVGAFAPLAVKYFKGSASSEVDAQATEAANFGITVALAQLAVMVLAGASVLGLGVILSVLPVVVGLGAIIFAVQAAIAVNHGTPYSYPVALRLLSVAQ